MHTLSATDRFVATLIAQFIVLILLLAIGFFPFPLNQTNIATGQQWIRYSMIGAIVALVLGILWAAWLARGQRRFDHHCVDRTIATYLVADIVIILLLICQEGGLCRSIFLPVLFLIPFAYSIVERRSKYRYAVQVVVIFCVVIGFYVSWHVGVPRISNVRELPLILGYSLPITDFSDLSHEGYDIAVFLAALFSALIPMAQKFGLWLYQKIKEAGPDEVPAIDRRTGS